MVAVRQFSTKEVAYCLSVVMLTLLSSTTLIISSTFSGVKPNCVRMKLGVLLSFTARWSDHATSSARIGLPEANLRPCAMVKVMVLPSSETSQLSAISGPYPASRFIGSKLTSLE